MSFDKCPACGYQDTTAKSVAHNIATYVHEFGTEGKTITSVIDSTEPEIVNKEGVKWVRLDVYTTQKSNPVKEVTPVIKPTK